MAFTSETAAYFCKTENTLVQDSQNQHIIATALALRNLEATCSLNNIVTHRDFDVAIASLVIHGDNRVTGVSW
jgi:hypothetical protein